MNCFGCNHPIARQTNFCPGCGKDVRPKRVRENARQAPREQGGQRPPQTPRIACPNPESQQGWEAAVQDRLTSTGRTAYLGTATLLVLAIPAYFAGGSGPVMAGMLAIGGLACGLYRTSELRYEHYARIPHARVDGGTRCIHCGHRGIYTHGAYKTTKKFHDCSKCKVTLYVS